jgi:hypothetical protein
MNFKTTDFFNNTEVNIDKVNDYIMSNPQNTKEVLEFVIEKVAHFKEFEDKKEYEKMMYEHRIKELYAEYMKDN